MAELAVLHKVVPELEKAQMIDASTCFDGQDKLRGYSEHLGFIEDVKIINDRKNPGLCVEFHNEHTGHVHQHCSNDVKPYYIKPATCDSKKKGGMRRMNKSITRRLRLGAARRRTRQRRGNKSVKSRRR